MGDGIYTALSGALAQQHSLDVIANNVANASTAGFRGDRAVFGEMLAGAQNQAPIDPRQPEPPTTDKFVRVDDNSLDMSSGVLRHTGNPLDLAVQGDGFFVVRTAQGDRLTRAGNFMLREGGELVTKEGYPVLGEDNGAIVFPAGTKDIVVTADGTVRANIPDGSNRGNVTELAKLSLKNVSDPRKLMREGTTLYRVDDPQGVGDSQAQIVQGHLEASNVNPVMGLNELISVSRTFDALQRVIETFQQIDQRTARDVGARNG